MSEIVHYSFYLESEPGVAAENLAPSFVIAKLIPEGSLLNIDAISINNLGDGLYSFSLDWSLYDAPRDDSSRNSIFIKIDTGLEILDQKFLTMRVERQDYLPELVDSIQATANNLEVSATSLNTIAEKILRIEEGHWVISNHKLYVFDKSVAAADRSIDNASHVFALFDSSGGNVSRHLSKNKY